MIAADIHLSTASPQHVSCTPTRGYNAPADYAARSSATKVAKTAVAFLGPLMAFYSHLAPTRAMCYDNPAL